MSPAAVTTLGRNTGVGTLDLVAARTERSSIRSLVAATDQWEKVAIQHGLSSAATAQMAPAFETAAREQARDFLGNKPIRDL